MSEAGALRNTFVAVLGLLLLACQPSAELESSRTVSSAPLHSVALHGHQELKKVQSVDGSQSEHYLPWFIGEDSVLHWCVRAPVERDTSRWAMSVSFDDHTSTDSISDFKDPAVRRGTVMCFTQVFAGEDENGERHVCAVLRDRQEVWRLPCIALYYEAHNAQWHALNERRASYLTAQNPATIIASMTELAGQAEQGEFPVFSTSAELIAAHFLKQRGESGDEQEIAQLLDKPREWLGSGFAHGIAGQLYYQRAVTHLDKGERNQAWSDIRLAEERYGQVAHPQAIVAVTRRAEILMQAGAVQEALEKLHRAIVDCDDGTCQEGLLRNAKNAMAWWLIQAPDMSQQNAQVANELLDQAIVGTSSIERSNILVNQAYLIAVRGGDPRKKLAQARERLTSHQSARVKSLNQWSEFVLALYRLRLKQDQAFLSSTQKLVNSVQPGYLRARVFAERGRYFRSKQQYAQARSDLEQAVQSYQFASRFNQRVVINPGQQALAYFELAGIAVDENDALLAWQWLDRLDASFLGSTCQPSTTQQETERVAELTAQLAKLNVPASLSRQAQRDAIRFQLQDELQELMRRQAPCESETESTSAIGRFRAFVSSDDVIVLRRDRSDDVHIEKRTRVDRADVLRRIEQMNARMISSARQRHVESVNPKTIGTEVDVLHDESWRELTMPLAKALLPQETTELASNTHFALHGLLQRIPVHALPYKEGWLSDVTNTVMSVKRGQALVNGSDYLSQANRFLFVVDPQNNLPDARQAERDYRALFPNAAYLTGAAATKDTVTRAMQQSDVWHFDSHARFNSAFPELSPLVLADGNLTAAQLVQYGEQLLLINLSGCQTGAWPVTATHGQFGMAGALARTKAQWVIASRVPLENAMAGGFNAMFYKHISAGKPVPEAYALALNGLKDTYTEAQWANLLLIGHFEGAERSIADSL